MLARKPPIIVLRRCPAWKGFAIFGEENSMIIRFCPFDVSCGSFKPRYGFRPKDFCFLSIEGMRSSASLSTLKKNCRNVPVAVGLCTSGDSGNLRSTPVSDGYSVNSGQLSTFASHSAASSSGFFPLIRKAGIGSTKSPFSNVWVH